MQYVFGYGSLIWQPNFTFMTRWTGWLNGYARRYCIKSYVYRGTHQYHGLVLGLTPNEDGCMGVLYGVDDDDWQTVRSYLMEREMVTSVYKPLTLPVWQIEETRCVMQDALVFVADEQHEQYVGQQDTTLDAQIERILRAKGTAGDNKKYVMETWYALEQEGIHDTHMSQLVDRMNSIERGVAF
jgi:glutathione-specific gamma-glutamylcyclotransferase